MILHTLRTKRRFPARWLTLLDGVVLGLVGAISAGFVDLIFPPLVWGILYFVGAGGLVTMALFVIPRRVMGWIIGVVALSMFSHAVALLLRGIGQGATISALVVGPVLWVAYALHMATRVAYWQMLDEKIER